MPCRQHDCHPQRGGGLGHRGPLGARGGDAAKTATADLYPLATGLIGLALMYSFPSRTHCCSSSRRASDEGNAGLSRPSRPMSISTPPVWWTCSTRWRARAIALIEREGIRVHLSRNRPAAASRLTPRVEEEARKVAQSPRWRSSPSPWPVVVLSGSCGGMMHHHARLFPERPEVAAFASSVRVHRVSGPGLPGTLARRGEASIVMHLSCSARREMQVHTTAAACWGSSRGSP